MGRDYEKDHAAFRKALRAVYKRPEVAHARQAVIEAEKVIKAAYEEVALNHWATLGNRASTGWGCQPEAEFQESLNPKHCAQSLADKLWEYFAQDAKTPPGMGKRC